MVLYRSDVQTVIGFRISTHLRSGFPEAYHEKVSKAIITEGKKYKAVRVRNEQNALLRYPESGRWMSRQKTYDIDHQ